MCVISSLQQRVAHIKDSLLFFCSYSLNLSEKTKAKRCLLLFFTRPSFLCCSRVVPMLTMLPAWTTAMKAFPAPAPHPAQISATSWKHSEVWCSLQSHYMPDTTWYGLVSVCFHVLFLWLPSTGLTSALASHVSASLELKMEKQDKDEMHDNLSPDNSDDESDRRDSKTPRGGTRSRWEHINTQTKYFPKGKEFNS